MLAVDVQSVALAKSRFAMKENRLLKVSIKPGCIGCGCCEFLCSEVFKVDGSAKVKSDADLEKNSACIFAAEKECPVGAIHVERCEEKGSS